MSYEDEAYKQSANVYDSLAQVFQELKQDKCGSIGATWNVPVEAMKGLTLKLVGDNHVLISYHSFQMSTPELMPNRRAEVKKFLDEACKELKKRFKQKTKKALTLKKINENEGVEKYSQSYGETSWASLGMPARQIQSSAGKYLIRCGRLYEFGTALKDE